MKENTWKKIFVFWSVLIFTLFFLLILQTTLWPRFLHHYNIYPQLTLPILIYFFINRSLQASLVLVFFMSVISSSFSSLPLFYLLLAYVLLCGIVKLRRLIHSGDKRYLIFEQVLVWSLAFPVLCQVLRNFSFWNIHFPASLWIYSLNALVTTFVALCFYPFLEKAFKEEKSFYVYV